MQKKYTKEEKEQAVKLYKEGESFENIRATLGVPESTLYRWTSGTRQSITINGARMYREDIHRIMRELEKVKKENELLRNSKCSIHAPLSEKLPEMIRLQEETNCDIHTLCDLFDVLRSTYYHRKLRNPKKTQLEMEDETLKPIIREIFVGSKNRFGSQMIKTKMENKGYQVSPKRIARLMREMGLQCNRNTKTLPEYMRHYRKNIYYTGNKVNQNFNQEKPNVVWVSDITYLRALDGVYYLCVIIDLFSRKIIGYTFAKKADTSIVIAALDMALSSRSITDELIFHSDQGCQYVSKEFRCYLKRKGILQSFSESGCPYDNAVAESFFATFKKDEIYKRLFASFEDLKQVIDEYINFFNNERPHYTLGMLTPTEKEDQYFQ